MACSKWHVMVDLPCAVAGLVPVDLSGNADHQFHSLVVLGGLACGVDAKQLCVEHDIDGRLLTVGKVPSVSSVSAKCADVRFASPKH